jgi:hypothetical protein
MPLFMDRHDLPEATAEDVAKAHARDLEVAGKHDVQWLSYWFDADSGSAFCLGRAPASENLVAAHQEAHGLVPNEIIGVSEDAVLRFLGVVRNPVDHTEVTSSFRTILFTDLEGSTAMAEELERSAFMSLLTEHDLIIRRSLVASGGREVKHTGDGIMASFDQVANSLECALAIQAGISARIAGARSPSSAFGSGWRRGSPSITTTISSDRPSVLPAASVTPPRPATSSSRMLCMSSAPRAASPSQASTGLH